MDRGKKLLELTCQKIHALTQPACVKNSELLYIEVNEAYASVFGQPTDAFAGHSGSAFDPGYAASQREDIERRCVVFGEDAETELQSPHDGCRYKVFTEQFVTDEGRIYLFEYFEPVEEIQLSPANDGPRNVAANSSVVPGNMLQILDEAIGAIDVPIFILSPKGDIVYCNSSFEDMYTRYLGEITIGENIADKLEISARDHVLNVDGHEPTQDEIDSWVEKRLSDYRVPYFETQTRFSDGRTVRIINRCLPNGYTVAVRIDVSEACEREALLQKQKEELGVFKAVLDNVPVANFVRDENQRLIYVNEAYCKLHGKSEDELLGGSMEDMFGHEAEIYAKSNSEVAQTGALIKRERTIRTSNGETIPVVSRLTWTTLPNGSRILAGSITEISDLKRREQDLETARQNREAAEKKLQTILDSVEFGVLVIDQGTLKVEMANQAIYELWDAPELGCLEGITFSKMLEYNHQHKRYRYDDQQFEEYQANWESSIRSDTPMPDKFVQAENGKHFVTKGKPIGEGRFIVTYTDITELRRREAEINAANNKLAETGTLMGEALDSMEQGFVITNAKMQILIGNEAANSILSLPKGTIEPGKVWAEIIEYCMARGDFSQSMDELNAAWKDCRETGQPMQMTACVGGQRWVRFEVKPTPDELRVIVMTDITSERERQSDLEKLVSRAETADRAKSEFLANMSHEIRTPMNGILGMAELLAKSELDSKQQTFTDIIVKSGNALLTIINDILDFSKIDAGQMKLRDGVFDPLEAVEDVATLLSAAAADKNVELIIKGHPDLPHSVHGDAGRFRQIVTNLVGNAIKFTERGHILISLGVSHNDGEQIISIDVADTGIGIPEDKLSDVFEKFSQVDGSSTRRHEGTGLGLAITAGLVNLFGGNINVKSKLGSGTTFSVELPMKAASAMRQYQAPVQKPGARILVIDDNAVNRAILMEQLNGWGYDACAAEDGPQGLAVLDATYSMQLPVDLVILDYHMPGMNGIEVAKAIRAKEWFDNTPVMFLTSMDMAADEQRFADMNIQAHLMKPARSQLLKATIAELLGSSSAETPFPKPAETAPAAQVQTVASTTTEAQTDVGGQPSIDIMIAEDNEVNQIVFTQILQETRFNFRIVNNGLEAVKTWQELKPPVILMDVSMPVMNGHEATRQIRAFEEKMGLPRTPIIGVTAHAQESDKELCLAAGMDDYMSKPISPERLQDKLLRWMPIGRTRKTG